MKVRVRAKDGPSARKQQSYLALESIQGAVTPHLGGDLQALRRDLLPILGPLSFGHPLGFSAPLQMLLPEPSGMS